MQGRKPAYLGSLIKNIYKLSDPLYLDSDYDRAKKQFERLYKKYHKYCDFYHVGNTNTRYNIFMVYTFTSYLLLDYNSDATSAASRTYSQFLNKCLHINEENKKLAKYYKYPIQAEDMVFFLRHFENNTPVCNILKDVFSFQLTAEQKTGISGIIEKINNNPEISQIELKENFDLLLDLLATPLD